MPRSIFARTGVDAEIIDAPEGFKGHGAADSNFARKFGPCSPLHRDGEEAAPVRASMDRATAMTAFSPVDGLDEEA